MKNSIKLTGIICILLSMVLVPGIAFSIDAEIASQVSKGISEWRLMNSGPEKKTEIKTGLATEPGYRASEDLTGQERTDSIEGVLALDETRRDWNASRFLSDPNAGLAYSILTAQSNANYYSRGMQEIQNNINSAKQYLDAEKMFLSGVAIPKASHASVDVVPKIVLAYNLISAPLTAYVLTNTAFSSASAISKLTHVGADIAIDRGLGFGVERFADAMCERKLWDPINQRIKRMDWVSETGIPNQQNKLSDFAANRNYYRNQLISNELDAVEIIQSGRDAGSLRTALSETGPISDDLMNAKIMPPSATMSISFKNPLTNKTTGMIISKSTFDNLNIGNTPILSASKIPDISKYTAPNYTISQTNLNRWRNSSEPFYKFATLNSPIIYTSYYSSPSILSSSSFNSYNLNNSWNSSLTNSYGYGYGSSFGSFGSYSAFSTLPGMSTFSMSSPFSNPFSSINMGNSYSTSYGSSFYRSSIISSTGYRDRYY